MYYIHNYINTTSYCSIYECSLMQQYTLCLYTNQNELYMFEIIDAFYQIEILTVHPHNSTIIFSHNCEKMNYNAYFKF